MITTDTDSFIFSVSYDIKEKPNINFWREHTNLADQLNTWSYDPETHPFFLHNQNCDQNWNVLGKFKDEVAPNQIITEAVALRPKAYSIQLYNFQTDIFGKKQACKVDQPAPWNIYSITSKWLVFHFLFIQEQVGTIGNKKILPISTLGSVKTP